MNTICVLLGPPRNDLCIAMDPGILALFYSKKVLSYIQFFFIAIQVGVIAGDHDRTKETTPVSWQHRIRISDLFERPK